MIAKSWSLATALSLLAWYVFAPSASPPRGREARDEFVALSLIMAGYLFALAYLAAFVTYRVASVVLS